MVIAISSNRMYLRKCVSDHFISISRGLSAILTLATSPAHGLDDLDFPPGFKFGVASAAYQVEGAWNVSDKSENIWDRFCHFKPERIHNSSNGDVACDSYHQWRRDIDMILEVGAHFYRFSIAWTRLLPNGFSNKISEDGKAYYNKLIDGLLEKGIEPVVTLYHWDLPQSLQDLGGWTNPLIVDWFADYARIAFSLYGDRVKTWVTINEPVMICDLPYQTAILAPGIIDYDVAPYLCNKHTLLAHAKAWRIYDKEFRPKYQGRVSLANHLVWIEVEKPEYEELAELARENMGGRYSHPVYSKEGGWPPTLKQAFDRKSKEQGLWRPKLPDLTQEEIELMRGTYDFYAMNHYTSRLIRPAEDGEQLLHGWPFGDMTDFDAKLYHSPEWKNTPSFWFFVNPAGLRNQLSWLKRQYGDIPFLITENGLGTRGGLDDVDRIDFYRDYLEQVLVSIKEDGVNVTGYTAWTLMDNFEWADGYSSQFGLYQVDFSSPDRTRTPRASAEFYKQVIRNHSLNVTIPVRN